MFCVRFKTLTTLMVQNAMPAEHLAISNVIGNGERVPRSYTTKQTRLKINRDIFVSLDSFRYRSNEFRFITNPLKMR